jgi:hypothetical protein
MTSFLGGAGALALIIVTLVAKSRVEYVDGSRVDYQPARSV